MRLPDTAGHRHTDKPLTPRATDKHGKLPARVASASLIALIFLCLTWELRLAPLMPGGTWLALKCLPLLIPLPGILNGRRYTYQWSSMLILLYLVEGAVRATSDPGVSRWPALAEVALSLTFFWATICYVRATKRERE